MSKNPVHGYAQGQPFVNVFPAPFIAKRSPTTTDLGYPIGQVWINEVSNTVFELTSFSAGTAIWASLGTGAPGGIVTITGDSGGAESPLVGNFNLKGTANQIAVTGSANTETLSLIGPYTPATYTAHGVLMGEGSTSIHASAAGTSGQVFTSGGAGADGAYQNLGVNSGLTAHGVLLGEGNSAIVATAVGTDGQVLTGNSAANPSWGAIGIRSGLTAHGVILGENASAFAATAAGTDGEILIGASGADPAFGHLTPGAGIIVTEGANTLSVGVLTGGYTVTTASTGGTLAIQNAYNVSQAGQASFALPASAAVGTVIKITSAQANAAGWIITQAANQEIWAGTSHTTNGATGTLAGARSTAVEITCIVADLEFIVTGGSGLTGLTFS